MSNQSEFVHLNGNIMPAEKACIYPGQSAVYYGTGCFETMLAEKTKIFCFNEHIQRLNSGLKYLGVPEHLHIKAATVRDDIMSLLEENGLDNTNARVRIQVSPDERRGYHLPGNSALNYFITVKEYNKQEGGISLAAVQTRVVPAECKPAFFKSSNMLHYRQAFREAGKTGADDGLMLNTRNFVAETSVANIFWKQGSDIFTPSEECDILPGITRGVLLRLLEEQKNLSVHTGTFSLKSLESADYAWITNSVYGIRPVTSLNGHFFGTDDDFLNDLKKRFRQFKTEYFS